MDPDLYFPFDGSKSGSLSRSDFDMLHIKGILVPVYMYNRISVVTFKLKLIPSKRIFDLGTGTSYFLLHEAKTIPSRIVCKN